MENEILDNSNVIEKITSVVKKKKKLITVILSKLLFF